MSKPKWLHTYIGKLKKKTDEEERVGPKTDHELILWTLSNLLVAAENVHEKSREGGVCGCYQGMQFNAMLSGAEGVLKEYGVEKKWRYWGF